MPIYTFTCVKCEMEVEAIVSIAKRYEDQEHDGCGGVLVREPGTVEMPTLGKPSFQGGVILSNGKKVAGHFGKSARAKKGWHRP